MKIVPGFLLAAIAAVLISNHPVMAAKADVRLEVLGTYALGIFDEGASEIAGYDPETRRLFITNGSTGSIDVVSIADPSSPALLFSIDLSAYGSGANSVAVRNGIVAAAVEANTKTDNGKVVFFDTDGNFMNQVPAGALPDMITFTPNGELVLVANEGEPNDLYTVDPEGSVTIVDIRKGIANAQAVTAGFAKFNSAALDPNIRIFGPGATVAQDLEPEYIAVDHNSKTAYVTLQENNAVAILDLKSREFIAIVGLGFKDHSLAGNALDASDRDGAINIANWPVYGMYQPDSIATVKYKNRTYLITANEGDSRDYDGFGEEESVEDLTLDPVAFPNAADLQTRGKLGRLTVTSTLGDTDGDGDYDALYAFGARSFSVWNENGTLEWDSGDDIEQITSMAYPDHFNASNTNNSFDNRSDNKGPEPEGLAVGKAYGRTYAFIGLERIGGVLVYDVTVPTAPRFVQYINNRDFDFDPEDETLQAGDLGPEGLLFISAEDSPSGKPLLVVANEISGSTTVYSIEKQF